MANPCSICPHDARAEIDRGLVKGESIRSMAARHGVSASAIRRHRDAHLRTALARAVEEERLDVDVHRLTSWAHGLQTRTLVLLERAEELDDLGNARGLIREARENLGLLGRLAGVLDGPTVHVDARRQFAVLGDLSEGELRRLAAGDDVVDGVAVEVAA